MIRVGPRGNVRRRAAQQQHQNQQDLGHECLRRWERRGAYRRTHGVDHESVPAISATKTRVCSTAIRDGADAYERCAPTAAALVCIFRRNGPPCSSLPRPSLRRWCSVSPAPRRSKPVPPRAAATATPRGGRAVDEARGRAVGAQEGRQAAAAARRRRRARRGAAEAARAPAAAATAASQDEAAADQDGRQRRRRATRKAEEGDEEDDEDRPKVVKRRKRVVEEEDEDARNRFASQPSIIPRLINFGLGTAMMRRSFAYDPADPAGRQGLPARLSDRARELSAA